MSEHDLEDVEPAGPNRLCRSDRPPTLSEGEKQSSNRAPPGRATVRALSPTRSCGPRPCAEQSNRRRRRRQAAAYGRTRSGAVVRARRDSGRRYVTEGGASQKLSEIVEPSQCTSAPAVFDRSKS